MYIYIYLVGLDHLADQANGQQNHRGFGFVIFHDALAIDELLGSAASRFIVLRNGTKLEAYFFKPNPCKKHRLGR